MNKEQFDDLIANIQSSALDFIPLADQGSERLRPSLSWVGHYLDVSGDDPSAILLKAAYGSAVESVSMTAFGMVRPAMLALRSHYELSLQYLYFKDHPKELKNLLDFRSQGPLPSVVKRYLKEYAPNFESRLGKLSKVARREISDPYGVLSGVAHGNALNSISVASMPHELVEEKQSVEQSLAVFKAVGESLADYYLSEFDANWLSVPELVKQDVIERLVGKDPASELML